MVIVHDLILLAHLIGFAAVLGGLLGQLRVREPEVSTTMFGGTILSFVTGVLLVAIAQTGPHPIDFSKVGVKVFLMLLLLVLVWANRRFIAVPRGVYWILMVLCLGEAAVAVFWP